jgi:hypothetical protein
MSLFVSISTIVKIDNGDILASPITKVFSTNGSVVKLDSETNLGGGIQSKILEYIPLNTVNPKIYYSTLPLTGTTSLFSIFTT